MFKPKRGTEESKAMTQLKGLKVYKIIDPIECHTFDDVWSMVALETDMFEELAILDSDGCQAKYNEYFGSDQGLTYNSFTSARKWMENTKHLCSE